MPGEGEADSMSDRAAGLTVASHDGWLKTVGFP